jgi:hypothetical protein
MEEEEVVEEKVGVETATGEEKVRVGEEKMSGRRGNGEKEKRVSREEAVVGRMPREERGW